MAAGVAQEINNPLCIIQGLAGTLRMSLESGEFNRDEVLADLYGIEDTVTRISKIVKGLGTIFKLR